MSRAVQSPPGVKGGPQSMCPRQILGISECDLIWRRVFADVVNFRTLRSSRISWVGPKVTGVPKRERQAEEKEEGRRPCEDVGGDGSDAATRKWTRQEGSSPEPPQRARPTGPLDFRLRSPERTKEMSIVLSHPAHGVAFWLPGTLTHQAKKAARAAHSAAQRGALEIRGHPP